MFRFLRNRARRQLRRQPIPEPWIDVFANAVPHYTDFSPGAREGLHRHAQVLLAEKRFAGCNGLELTETMKVTIAGQAAVLMLGRDFDYFPRLGSVLVYPSDFVAEVEEHTDWGLVVEEEAVHAGESWSIGTVVLSWREIERDTARRGGRHVVLHEFAHQVDQEDGASDGWPRHLPKELRQEWYEVMSREYETHCTRVGQGRRTVLDPYGAEHPSEFFAVVTETFFMTPHPLRDNHRDLYRLFAALYGQDPAARIADARPSAP